MLKFPNIPETSTGTSHTAMNDLRNRLQTFTDWPQHVAVKPKNLAEAGFFYVGKGPNDDTVSCFDCRGELNNWQAGDIPEQKHREYFGGFCQFVGRDVLDSALPNTTPNVDRYDPIEDDDMENEQQRLRSFGRNNGWQSVVDSQKLAAAGFYFTGIGDNVKCFACDLCLSQWEAEDDPISEHLRNEPDCPFLSRLSSNFGMASSVSGDLTHVYKYNRPNYTETLNMQSAFRSGLALSEPKHVQTGTTRTIPNNLPTDLKELEHQSQLNPPNYANEHARLHSFINWPKECPVRPKELIDAGFYYTGGEDKAQCFMCGVILAGWEPEDTPWGEHKRWSNDCSLVKEYLLRRMPNSPLGENSEIPRFPKEQSCTPPKKGFDGWSVDPGTCESVYATAKVGRLAIEQSEIDTFHHLNMSQRTGKKSEVFHIQKAVQELVNQGYDFATVEEAIMHKVKVCDESIESTKELRDAVHSFMGKNSASIPKENKRAGGAIATESTNSIAGPKTNISPEDEHAISEKATGSSILVDPLAIHRQFEKMQEARSCSICFDADVGVVFLPCGHLVCCPKCASEIQHKPSKLCPVCRTHIENSIQIYFS